MALSTFADRAATTFVDKHQASRITGLSPDTLKTYRLSQKLLEGVHYVALNSRTIRYNAPLLESFIQHGGLQSPEHQRDIDAYLQSLNSNQPKRRGRPAKTPHTVGAA